MKRDLTPWCFHFEQYVGRRLSKAERSLIAPLERARVRCDARPVVVVDPPGVDSTEILLDYLHYRLSVQQGDLQALVIHPRRADFRRREFVDKRIRQKTSTRPDAPRGLSPNFTLLLNAHLYRTSSPYYSSRKNFRRWLATVMPMHMRSGFTILHFAYCYGRKSHVPDGLMELFNVRPPAEPPSEGTVIETDRAIFIFVAAEAPVKIRIPPEPILKFLD